MEESISRDLADIRSVYIKRGYTGSTEGILRDIEQEVADLRDLLDFD